MVHIFYTTLTQGQLAHRALQWTEGLTLEKLASQISQEYGFHSEEFSWFRQSLPLRKDSLIHKGDRLIALRPARLSPATWRLQRVSRLTNQYVK